MKKTYLIHQDIDKWCINKNLFYLLWLNPSLWTVIIDDKKNYLIFDARYFNALKKSSSNIEKRISAILEKKVELEFILLNTDLFEILKNLVIDKKIVIEENLGVWFYKKLKNLSPQSIEIQENIFENQRIIKNNTEIKYIKKAISIINKVYIEVEKLNKNWEIIWKKEIEIRKIIQKLILEFWWEKESFPTIVAFWKNSAIPHHETSSTIIKDWPLLIDIWCVYMWYCSDFTRTFWVWEKTNNYFEFKKVKKIVIEAHNLWLKFLKEWISWRDLDKIVRNYITESWYWECFIHSTGHWVWLQIHEKPWISNKKWDQILKKWMVFTIEPWIYLPWRFWVRWENIVIFE